MKLSEIEWVDVTLSPEEVVRRGAPDDELEDLDGVVAIGRPFVVDATKLARASHDELDAEIKLLTPTHVFSYLRFAVSIRPGEKHDVRFVALDVELKSPSSEAICWSMEPMRVDQEFKTRAESKLSSKLKLEVPKIETVDIGTEASESGEYVTYVPTIEAFNLNRSDPAWELRSVEGRRLSGIQILHMVVRVPKNTAATARVSLRADIFRRSFIWRYRARRPDKSDELFAVPLT